MKRFAALVVTAALCAGLAGMPGAVAHHSCEGTQNSPPAGYLYCGEHVRLDKLPLRFKFAQNTAPAAIDDDLALTIGINQAMVEWNRYWPVVKGSICGEALCFDGFGGPTTAAQDGTNAIFFSSSMSFSGCSPKDGAIAVACIWYEGTSGAARHRIREVDIALNANKSWWLPGLTDTQALAVGEAMAPYPDLANSGAIDAVTNGAGRYDFQSVVTHELGHALGLEDVGSGEPWPADLTDAGFYMQTMYTVYNQGTTHKRTLAEGDIAGLQRVAVAVMTDL